MTVIDRNWVVDRHATGKVAAHRFAILVFPGFPMMAFSAVIEPLRAANTVAKRALYEWITVSGDDGIIVASNGIAITPNYTAKEAPEADYVVVCSGGDADRLSLD